MGQRNLERNLKKYIELNANKNTTHQNLCDIMKVVVRGKMIALNAYIRT